MGIYDLFMSPLERKILVEIRGKIIPRAYGHVLEIGFGTGANFPYYQTRSIKKIFALEKNVSKDIKKNQGVRTLIEKTGIPIEYYAGDAQKLPFPADTFDTVIETLVFCTVPNLHESINEVYRVLKPGGLFIYLDHVLPSSKGLAGLFRALNLLWPKVTGGCNLTRSVHETIAASGFIMERQGSAGMDIFRWGLGHKPVIN